MLQHLVLFDIDGTLLSTGGAGRTALHAALYAVYNAEPAIDSYDLAGRTIREIVRDLMGEAGVPQQVIEARFEVFKSVWANELRRVIGNYRVRRFPGTLELVQEMARRPDVLAGIVTANIAATAHVKLEAAGFDLSLFAVGAYGDISEVRAELVQQAIQQAAALSGVRFAPEHIWHIGDSALDILCARQAGIRSIGVLTGGKSRAELLDAGADFVFDDLSDYRAVLATIAGEP